jgi:hypothetical protein
MFCIHALSNRNAKGHGRNRALAGDEVFALRNPACTRSSIPSGAEIRAISRSVSSKSPESEVLIPVP